jgi:hypothetical protein
MFNIVNSNVNAEFFINAAALLNPEIKTLGSININPNKGTFVDMYHEAWHVFTQLYMTKEQKKNLYKEVKYFKDANGKQPYLKMSAFQIEEMLAEDFRSYMKKAYTKKGMPQRNTLFRRMVEFLKQLFGKALNKFKKGLKVRFRNSVKFILYGLGLYKSRVSRREIADQINAVVNLASRQSKRVMWVQHQALQNRRIYLERRSYKKYYKEILAALEKHKSANFAVVTLPQSFLVEENYLHDCIHLSEKGHRELAILLRAECKKF